jgi:hypothetical protein
MLVPAKKNEALQQLPHRAHDARLLPTYRLNFRFKPMSRDGITLIIIQGVALTRDSGTINIGYCPIPELPGSGLFKPRGITSSASEYPTVGT